MARHIFSLQGFCIKQYLEMLNIFVNNYCNYNKNWGKCFLVEELCMYLVNLDTIWYNM